LLKEGVIAERRWQESQAQLHNQAAQRDAAQQLLQLAGMSAADIKQLAANQQLNGQITVRSPISGVVLERLATLGARLDNQAPLYRIADLSELWLEIKVPQERAHLLKTGDRLQNLDGTAIATVKVLGSSVDSSNQTIITRAIIDTPNAGHYRSGQTLTVQVAQPTAATAFTVPASAIAQHAGQHYLFIKTAEGFTATAVSVLGKIEQDSVISGPLNGQESIALHGVAAIKANWLGIGGGE
jgi:cobalt-zinc-cadmium efflux system membrane fusion protein